MAMKHNHPDFGLRVTTVTSHLGFALRHAYRLDVLAKLGSEHSVNFAIAQMEENIRHASEALAIIKNGE